MVTAVFTMMFEMLKVTEHLPPGEMNMKEIYDES